MNQNIQDMFSQQEFIETDYAKVNRQCLSVSFFQVLNKLLRIQTKIGAKMSKILFLCFRTSQLLPKNEHFGRQDFSGYIMVFIYEAII